jgi:hypothetical protein
MPRPRWFAVLPLVAACGGASSDASQAVVSAPVSTVAEPEPVVADGPPVATFDANPVAMKISGEPACEKNAPSAVAPAALSAGGRAAWAKQPFLPMRQLVAKIQNDERALHVATPSAPNRPALLLELAHDYFEAEAHSYQACMASMGSPSGPPIPGSHAMDTARQNAGSAGDARGRAIVDCAALTLEYPAFAATHFCPTS